MIASQHACRMHVAGRVCASVRRPLRLTNRFASSFIDTVREGDVVLLKSTGSGTDHTYLTKPLVADTDFHNKDGTFKANDIIGIPYHNLVWSSNTKGRKKAMRARVPSLSEYVTLTPRNVTPIYAQDCNLIVSLLDIHVESPTEAHPQFANGPQLNILEAGTGHGSLTIHLARAIQAANHPLPAAFADGMVNDEKPGDSHEELLKSWKARRRAVITTVERFESNTNLAKKTIAQFRRGMYLHHIDFHTGNVSDFIDARIKESPPDTRSQVFSHIILDLPSVHTHLGQASQVLKEGGTLMVWAPSITQIAQCVKMLRDYHLPLSYSTVLELGNGMSAGRQWDVRAARVRNEDALGSLQEAGPEEGQGELSLLQRLRTGIAQWLVRDLAAEEGSNNGQTEVPPERWEMVARPSVGHRVAGGGFLGVWHRKHNVESHEEAETREVKQRPEKQDEQSRSVRRVASKR